MSFLFVFIVFVVVAIIINIFLLNSKVYSSLLRNILRALMSGCKLHVLRDCFVLFILFCRFRFFFFCSVFCFILFCFVWNFLWWGKGSA